MKGEIYNFILHSDIGRGTTTANKAFFIDWNRLPNSRYKLTFSFTSSTLTIATTFDAMLYISELGCCNNTILGGILIICRVEDRIWSFRNIIETSKATTKV